MISLLIRKVPLKKRIYSGYFVTGAVALVIALLSYGSLVPWPVIFILLSPLVGMLKK